MRTQPETRARSAQEAGKRALNLGASKPNQACRAESRRSELKETVYGIFYSHW